MNLYQAMQMLGQRAVQNCGPNTDAAWLSGFQVGISYGLRDFGKASNLLQALYEMMREAGVLGDVPALVERDLEAIEKVLANVNE